MAKRAASNQEIEDFITAVFPEAPQLAMAAFDEAHTLRTATTLITNLRASHQRLYAALRLQLDHFGDPLKVIRSALKDAERFLPLSGGEKKD